MECTVELVRSLFLFEKLTDEQLEWVCREGALEQFAPGPVYLEGEPATCFYVLVDGEVVLSGRASGDEVDISRTSQRGVYAGAWQAYLGDQVPQIYNNSMRVTVPSTFLVLDAESLAQMMREWFPMALHLLEGLFFGIRNSFQAVGQRERLLALGSLSAGLTHELNNPASAAVRATGILRERVAGMRHKLAFIGSGRYSSDDLAGLVQLQEDAAAHVAKAPILTAMEASDREEELGEWLQEHGVAAAWDIASTMVQAGLEIAWLDQVYERVGESNFASAVGWLYYSVETELLMNEIQDSTERISALVASAKQYSQLDRAPWQSIDVHELLDSTLVMLAAKLKGVQVIKQYDRTLPTIGAYAAELNQVWTNLIDNAIQAMAGLPATELRALTITTSQVEDSIRVEIRDCGPGVPAEIRTRIFEPFFTTKAVGEGTGLGLDISYRIVVKKHHGDLRVQSQPGDTRFVVTLPVAAEPPATPLIGSAPLIEAAAPIEAAQP
jgi:signal transduction histidine kinase